ncbi:hypothetical protein B0A55_00436 [Friedmanniomyces simplex]|uniref:Uncharacterized protein n=1 Tax=Friedmanniomyces simplex TaxID=329884 RepID=A0A4U0Y2F2_9PEZI|nr:hypothetical protein B0A55_00436 [Friedmanniomyces simplex]
MRSWPPTHRSSDGIVLTGYSVNATWQRQFLISTNFHLARENQSQRFGDRGTGFVTWGDELANQYIFLSYPHFDPSVLAYAEANKYPFSVSEVLTGGVIPYNATAFTKPVLLISGAADLSFCGSDCYGILEQAAPCFPAAKPFETYVQPNTGHGMNLHYNATGVSTLDTCLRHLLNFPPNRYQTYTVIQNFFEEEYLTTSNPELVESEADGREKNRSARSAAGSLEQECTVEPVYRSATAPSSRVRFMTAAKPQAKPSIQTRLER